MLIKAISSAYQRYRARTQMTNPALPPTEQVEAHTPAEEEPSTPPENRRFVRACKYLALNDLKKFGEQHGWRSCFDRISIQDYSHDEAATLIPLVLSCAQKLLDKKTNFHDFCCLLYFIKGNGAAEDAFVPLMVAAAEQLSHRTDLEEFSANHTFSSLRSYARGHAASEAALAPYIYSFGLRAINDPAYLRSIFTSDFEPLRKAVTGNAADEAVLSPLVPAWAQRILDTGKGSMTGLRDAVAGNAVDEDALRPFLVTFCTKSIEQDKTGEVFFMYRTIKDHPQDSVALAPLLQAAAQKLLDATDDTPRSHLWNQSIAFIDLYKNIKGDLTAEAVLAPLVPLFAQKIVVQGYSLDLLSQLTDAVGDRAAVDAGLGALPSHTYIKIPHAVTKANDLHIVFHHKATAGEENVTCQETQTGAKTERESLTAYWHRMQSASWIEWRRESLEALEHTLNTVAQARGPAAPIAQKALANLTPLPE